MRESTEPYCFIILEPRCRRGGTMRPENSSKVWLKTFCEWSRLSTLWSSVTPATPGGEALLRDAFGCGVGFELRKPGVEIARTTGNSRERGLGGEDGGGEDEGCES